MILVADSGSSKTDFHIIDNNNRIIPFSCAGLSPFFVDSKHISNEVANNFPVTLDKSEISEVYFFGAGCSSDERIGIVYEGLLECFPDADIEINTDMHGAALACFGNDPGLVAILGTGSNSCLWDGRTVIQSTPSLGYILGDEGSGAILGKRLLQLLLNGDLPEELENQFYNTYDVSLNTILDNIYRGEKPNAFMASFSYFWVENLHHPFVKFTVNECFLAFLEKNICKYANYENFNLRCVGSIAHFFREIIEECALAYNIKIDMVIQQPIHNLSKYFINMRNQ